MVRKINNMKRAAVLLLVSVLTFQSADAMDAKITDLHEKDGSLAVCVSNRTVYKDADIDSSKLGTIKAGTVFRYSQEHDEFLKIRYGDSCAYVLSDNVLCGKRTTRYVRKHQDMFNKKVKVATETASLYAADTQKELASVSGGAEFLISGESDYFYQVAFDGQEALLAKEDAEETIYVKVADFSHKTVIDLEALIESTYKIQMRLLQPAQNLTAPLLCVTGSAFTVDYNREEILSRIFDDAQRMVIEYATQFVGSPYVWGGNSLTDGTDCSGFVKLVYEHFGIDLPRTSQMQSNYGKAVSPQDLQPGDLLFYMRGSKIGHVSMYIGSGKIIHAKGSRYGIVIDNVDYSQPVCIRRIINFNGGA